jgi:hypothetical protein
MHCHGRLGTGCGVDVFLGPRGIGRKFARKEASMARFTTATLIAPAPQPGVHVAKIIKARERTSEAGNPMLQMQAQFPAGEQLGFIITFVPKAAKLVGYFCRSIDLELPHGEGIEVEIRPVDFLGRYFYPVGELDGQGLEAIPKITRFLSRSEALAARPELAGIQLQPQGPRALTPVTGGGFKP